MISERRCIELIAIALIHSAAPPCWAQSATDKGGSVAGQEVKADSKSKEEIHVSVILDSAKSPSRLLMVVSNDTDASIWIPIEPAPSYKSDRQSHRLEMWFGYCDDVHGSHKGDYIVPVLHLVAPGSRYKFEVTSQELIKDVKKHHGELFLQARIASKSIRLSALRNEQPLEEYLRNSFVIRRKVVLETQ